MLNFVRSGVISIIDSSVYRLNKPYYLQWEEKFFICKLMCRAVKKETISHEHGGDEDQDKKISVIDQWLT